MENKTYDGNSEAIEAWNTVLFDKFCRYRDILTTGLGIHGETAMDRGELRAGARVLDVGCGFGDTTLVLARRVGDTGIATGVDAAERFIEVARREAKEAGIHNASFLVADV
ncbi:MAG TPA: class I SAM-dependent methyltransferase, partial [Labilithrix sp.]|nr:class I SAM-dependent methyltransferase [Labilithrix sp.]